jgi:hypothetical protein
LAGFEEDWLSRVRKELPGAQEYVEIFAKTMEGDVCTADESEGWSPYFLLDAEILALILAGRLVGKGGESSPFSLSRLSRELRGGTRQKIGLQERPTYPRVHLLKTAVQGNRVQ